MQSVLKGLVAAAVLASGAAHAVTYVNTSTGALGNGVSNITPFAGGPAVDQVTVDLDFTYTITAPPPVNDTGNLFTLWMDDGTSTSPFTTGPNLGMRVNMGPGGADYYLSVSGLTNTFAPIPLTPTVNLFGYFFKSTGPGGAGDFDRAAFWVNPTAAEKTNYTNPDLIVNTFPGSFSSLSRMGLRVSGMEVGSTITVNSLTITDAVPEPSAIAMALAGLGLVGVVARRRRPV